MTKVVRLHASGAVETFQNTDYPGYYPAATIVGAPPQWDDNSDATWGRSQTQPDGVTDNWRAVAARLDALPATVTSAKVVSITGHVRYDTAHPGGAQLRDFVMSLWDYAHRTSLDTNVWGRFASSVAVPTPPNDDLIHEADFPIYRDTAPYDLTAVLAALWGGALLNLGAVITGTSGSELRSAVTVYEAWVDVEYAADSMVRQWPNDTGGLTVTPRLYPPPRTGRIYGGHH